MYSDLYYQIKNKHPNEITVEIYKGQENAMWEHDCICRTICYVDETASPKVHQAKHPDAKRALIYALSLAGNVIDVMRGTK